MERNSVILKVQKLMEKSDTSKGNTIEEASTAIDLAFKLLKKHHLTMSQVMATVTSNTRNVNSDFFQLIELEVVSYKANAIPLWMANIILAVNKITETKTLIKKTQRPGKSCCDLRILFVGDVADAQTSAELFDFLKIIIMRLSTGHVNEIQGKFKQWRSFAEGCSDKILSRATELEEKFLEKTKSDKNDPDLDFSVSNFQLDDDDEYEELCSEIDDFFKDRTSLVLYNKYQQAKLDKIEEYLDNIDVKDEKKVKKISRTDKISFERGTESGEKIPLNVPKGLKAKNRRS